MKNIELASPSEMSARARAGEITSILAAVIVRTPSSPTSRNREVGLGFPARPARSYNPHQKEKL